MKQSPLDASHTKGNQNDRDNAIGSNNSKNNNNNDNSINNAYATHSASSSFCNSRDAGSSLYSTEEEEKETPYTAARELGEQLADCASLFPSLVPHLPLSLRGIARLSLCAAATAATSGGDVSDSSDFVSATSTSAAAGGAAAAAVGIAVGDNNAVMGASGAAGVVVSEMKGEVSEVEQKMRREAGAGAVASDRVDISAAVTAAETAARIDDSVDTLLLPEGLRSRLQAEAAAVEEEKAMMSEEEEKMRKKKEEVVQRDQGKDRQVKTATAAQASFENGRAPSSSPGSVRHLLAPLQTCVVTRAWAVLYAAEGNDNTSIPAAAASGGASRPPRRAGFVSLHMQEGFVLWDAETGKGRGPFESLTALAVECCCPPTS